MRSFFFILLILYLNIDVFGSISSNGVLVNNAINDRDTIVTILNEDNSIYLKIPLIGNTSIKLPHEFSPFAINIPEDIFLIEVIGEDQRRYKVSIGNGKTKFISKSDKSVKYYKWTDFILKYDYNSIIISKKKNPVRISPSDNSKRVKFVDYEGNAIRGVKFKGDWLKVTIEDIESFENNKTSGWVRWREKGQIIIDFRLND